MLLPVHVISFFFRLLKGLKGIRILFWRVQQEAERAWPCCVLVWPGRLQNMVFIVFLILQNNCITSTLILFSAITENLISLNCEKLISVTSKSLGSYMPMFCFLVNRKEGKT